MFCRTCGNKLDEDAMFCPNCGDSVSEDTITEANRHEQEPKNNSSPKLKRKTPKMIGTAIAAVAVVIIALFLVRTIFGVTQDTKDPMVLKSSNDTGMYYFGFSSGARVQLNTDSFPEHSLSMDGTSASALIDYSSEDGGTLVYVTKSGATKIADNVFSFVLSSGGQGVAYVTDAEDDSGNLMLYDVGKKKSSKIDSNVLARSGGYRAITISPDGKSVGYAADYDYTTDDFLGYVSINGEKPVSLGESCYPFALSDKGKYIYLDKYNYEDDTLSSYVMLKEDRIKLSTRLAYYEDYHVCFNKDYSQILYMNDGKTYICDEAGEKRRLLNADFDYIFAPAGTEISYEYSYGYRIERYNMDSLSGCAISTEGRVDWICSDFDTEAIAFRPLQQDNCMISSDGKSILFVNYDYVGNLHYIENPEKSLDGEDIGGNLEITSFAATDDLSKIYFINAYNELRYVTKNGEDKRIADDVYEVIVEPSSKTAYFIGDYENNSGAGTLYMSKNGDKAEAVPGGAGAYRLFLNGESLWCDVENDDGEYEYYCVSTGKRFD